MCKILNRKILDFKPNKFIDLMVIQNIVNYMASICGVVKMQRYSKFELISKI